MMRILVGLSLLIALPLIAGCSGDQKKPTLQDAAIDASGEAQEIIGDVVKDEHRAEMAKRSAEKVMLTISSYYASVAAQRNELVKVAGDTTKSRADCQAVVNSLKGVRKQFSEQLVDEWLLVRAWMTPEEWVTFNEKLQRSMDQD